MNSQDNVQLRDNAEASESFFFTDYEEMDNYSFDYCMSVNECYQLFSKEGWSELQRQAKESGLSTLEINDTDTLVGMAESLKKKSTFSGRTTKVSGPLQELVDAYASAQSVSFGQALSAFMTVGIQTVADKHMSHEDVANSLKYTTEDRMESLKQSLSSIPRHQVSDELATDRASDEP